MGKSISTPRPSLAFRQIDTAAVGACCRSFAVSFGTSSKTFKFPAHCKSSKLKTCPVDLPVIRDRLFVIVIVISKLLKRHSKAKSRAPAYSLALRRLRWEFPNDYPSE